MNAGHFKRGALAALVLQGLWGAACAQSVIYVDNTVAGACMDYAADCGTTTKPYANLQLVVNNMMSPGSLIIVAGGGKPYRGFLRPNAANWTGASTAQSVLRAWAGKATPVIAGSREFLASLWTPVTRGDGVVLYKLNLDTTGALSELNVDGQIPSPQQVFVGGRALKQANVDASADLKKFIINPASATVETMPPDSFLFVRDVSGLSGSMYLRLSAPLTAAVEISTDHFLFDAQNPKLNNITISGLEFKHSNTSAYSRGAALVFGGGGVTLNQLHVHDVDDVGIATFQGKGAAATPNKITNSIIERAGQLGVGGPGGAGFQFTGNTLRDNNTRGFDDGWEAGGAKFIGTPYLKNANISNNKVLWNKGPGIWFDTYQSGNTVSNNLFAFNRIGLFLELSSNNVVQNNTFVGNYGQGIQLKGTGNVVTGNYLVYNDGDGISASTFGDKRIVNPSQPTWGVINNAFRDNRYVSNGGEFGTRDDGKGRQFYVALSNTVERNRYCTNGYTLVGLDSTQYGVPSSKTYGVSDYGNGFLTFASWQAAPLTFDAATTAAKTAGTITDAGSTDLAPSVSTTTLGKLRAYRLTASPNEVVSNDFLTLVGQLKTKVNAACQW